MDVEKLRDFPPSIKESSSLLFLNGYFNLFYNLTHIIIGLGRNTHIIIIGFNRRLVEKRVCRASPSVHSHCLPFPLPLAPALPVLGILSFVLAISTSFLIEKIF
jgi:hypothetical protein